MKIGDKNVVYQQTMLIPDNTDASFDVTIGRRGPFPFVVRFKPEKAEVQDKPKVLWQNENRIVRIEFQGWTDALGTAFAGTEKLGTLEGVGDLFLSVFHLRVGTVNHLNFQLMTQGEME